MDLNAALKRLDAVYATLPALPCKGCGRCCVAPHMTFVEFVRALDGMLACWPRERMLDFVARAAPPEPRYAGNVVCRMQNDNGRCDLYEQRPFICRIEGAPELDRMGVRDFTICPNITDEDLAEPITQEAIFDWTGQVYEISDAFAGINEEPYWLSAITPACWFAVLLDEKITQPSVLAVRSLVDAEHDLAFLRPYYVDHTQLSLKLNLIDDFFTAAQNERDAELALSLMERVVGDFSATGSWYQEEGLAYLGLMRQILGGADAAQADPDA